MTRVDVQVGLAQSDTSDFHASRSTGNDLAETETLAKFVYDRGPMRARDEGARLGKGVSSRHPDQTPLTVAPLDNGTLTDAPGENRVVGRKRHDPRFGTTGHRESYHHSKLAVSGEQFRRAVDGIDIVDTAGRGVSSSLARLVLFAHDAAT